MSTPENRTITLVEALREALFEELERDDQVIVLGEDVAEAGGVFKVYAGLYERFGPDRVLDTPISEAGFVGTAVGAAVTGMRPVVDVMFCDFITLAMDQIVNQAAKLRYMTGGQLSVPLVIHTAVGAGRSAAAQHSQSLQAWFAHVPGLKVALPSTPRDAKGLLKSAIRDDNPVVFMADKAMYQLEGEVPEGDFTIPLGEAEIKRPGQDVSLVATLSMVQVALEAAERLAEQGIEAEVVDPRTLKPLDAETILASVRKTHRAVVIDEGYLSYGATAEIASVIADRAFDWLDAPVKRMGAMDVPVPYSPALEPATIPSSDDLVRVVLELVGGA
ncbi:MAG: alpha-ketoacid dehydrogenase subunit beta [Anaerolineae bacterium]|jgi:pyruvate dehydrogenase E1 component beta subunit